MLKTRLRHALAALALAALLSASPAAPADAGAELWRVNGVPVAMLRVRVPVAMEALGVALEDRWQAESGGIGVATGRAADRWTLARQRGARHESLVLQRAAGDVGTDVLVLVAVASAPRERGRVPPAAFGGGWRVLSVLEPLTPDGQARESQWLLRTERLPPAAAAGVERALASARWRVSSSRPSAMHFVEATRASGEQLTALLSAVPGGTLAFVRLRATAEGSR